VNLQLPTGCNRIDNLHTLDLEPPLPEEPEDIGLDSPWTIEAVDGKMMIRNGTRYLIFSLFLIQLPNDASISPQMICS